MTLWINRPREEAALFNPAFCALVTYEAVRGYTALAKGGMSYALAFLPLPLVLHRRTREAFPRTTRTSLPVWLEQNPGARVGFAERATALAPFVREALVFGANHGLLRLDGANLVPDKAPQGKPAFERDRATPEVSACLRRAEFVGKWMAGAGKPATVFALLGVRP